MRRPLLSMLLAWVIILGAVFLASNGTIDIIQQALIQVLAIILQLYLSIEKPLSFS